MIIIITIFLFSVCHAIMIVRDSINRKEYTINTVFVPSNPEEIKAYITSHQGPFSIKGEGYSQ